VQVRRKGTFTLPSELRRRYQFGEGDLFTLVDLGEGNLLLTPHVSELARLADQAAQVLAQEGVSLEEILQALDEERERYYHDHYHQDARA
jgi:bifunctional DNA-binding transcriptional regulator/antitoxin component of YhaV-PrlF toxin-antitoxin module